MQKNPSQITSALLSFLCSAIMAIIFVFMMTNWSRAESSTSEAKKDHEYLILKKKVTDLHNEALVNSNGPFIVKEMNVQKYVSDFKGKYCEDLSTDPLRASKCDHRLWNSIFDQLSEKYFDADANAILGRCHFEPVVCMDFESLELIFRIAHNKGIESSRFEKLKYLDAWKLGKVSDNGLADLLGFDFKDGMLTTSR